MDHKRNQIKTAYSVVRADFITLQEKDKELAEAEKRNELKKVILPEHDEAIVGVISAPAEGAGNQLATKSVKPADVTRIITDDNKITGTAETSPLKDLDPAILDVQGESPLNIFTSTQGPKMQRFEKPRFSAIPPFGNPAGPKGTDGFEDPDVIGVPGSSGDPNAGVPNGTGHGVPPGGDPGRENNMMSNLQGVTSNPQGAAAVDPQGPAQVNPQSDTLQMILAGMSNLQATVNTQVASLKTDIQLTCYKNKPTDVTSKGFFSARICWLYFWCQ